MGNNKLWDEQNIKNKNDLNFFLAVSTGNKNYMIFMRFKSQPNEKSNSVAFLLLHGKPDGWTNIVMYSRMFKLFIPWPIYLHILQLDYSYLAECCLY